MSRRFGKARVPNCECTYNFTCRHCLAASGPTTQNGASLGPAREFQNDPIDPEFNDEDPGHPMNG